MKPGFVKFPDGLGENKRGECLPIEPLVRSISNRFDEENILWAVMRNAEDLPEFTRNDIDFLISHTDLGKVTDIIKQCAQQT